MCKSPLHPLLQALPKCEHHMHLEGSLTPQLLFQLAAKNQIELPSPSSDPAFTSPSTLQRRYENFTSLDDFLHYYFIGQSVLRTASDYELLTYSYLSQAHDDAAYHVELSFDPQAHTSRAVPYALVVEGINRGRARALRDHGITSLLILCFLRHLPVAAAQQSFDAAWALGHFRDGTLVGIGLEGSEMDFPPERFRDVYRAAEDRMVFRTAHAGEEGDASYIRRAVEECHVQRIDHGIHLADLSSYPSPSPSPLLEEIASRKILLTICPLSNIRLRCLPSIRHLPLRIFLDHDVQFSINSDDPAYFGGGVLANYCAVQEAFGLEMDVWERIALMAIEGSWCGEERKMVLRGRMRECVRSYGDRITAGALV